MDLGKLIESFKEEETYMLLLMSITPSTYLCLYLCLWVLYLLIFDTLPPVGPNSKEAVVM